MTMPLAAIMYVSLCASPGHCEPRQIAYKPSSGSAREEQMRECEDAKRNITLYQNDPTRVYVCEYRKKQVMANAAPATDSEASRQHHANVAAAD
ncbi:hypothetical protein [Pseudomonas sp. Marseille-Q5115]|uniref:hypothetical protein n=1 Tax=Pseudomonas sp. Marseille-Q5115 TaxID=2866593 RepID=UPI001CE4014C|nr:hypothetical protein [Pseudomonas sp. Marseille-Q5115]